MVKKVEKGKARYITEQYFHEEISDVKAELRQEMSDMKDDLEEKIADTAVSIIDSVQQMFDKQEVKIEALLDAKINYRQSEIVGDIDTLKSELKIAGHQIDRNSDDINSLSKRVLILEKAH